MTRINLLPAEERSRAAREQGLLLAIVGLIILVVALGAVYFMSYRQVQTKQTQINDTAAQIDVANVQVAALRPYQTMQVQRQAMATTAAQILNSRVVISNVLEEIGLLLPTGVSLTQFNLNVPSYMVAGSNDSAAAAASTTTFGATADLTLTGDSNGATLYASHDQIAALLTQLGLMPQIMNIKLVSALAVSGFPSDLTYTVTANLRPFATTPPLAPTAPSITMGGGQ
jgi:Tfp pilus assembly protein PilN